MASAQAMIETHIRRVASVDEEAIDSLAIEEPLEIQLGLAVDGRRTTRSISITMRTPGDDEELAAGFLFTEGIINSPAEIVRIRHWPQTVEKRNTILIELADDVKVDLDRLERHFYTSSSCGVCGKTSIAAIATSARRIASDLILDAETIIGLADRLRRHQSVFDSTGGLHASGLFALDGTLDIIREDIGRHNALDKVIGGKFITGHLPLAESVLLVSGRASFELVQKALMAGIPVMVAVGAPSSLAVELARDFGLTLIGFVREGRFNIYAGGQRIETRALSSGISAPNIEMGDENATGSRESSG